MKNLPSYLLPFLLLALLPLTTHAQEIHACVVMPVPTAPTARPAQKLPPGVQKAVALDRSGQFGGRSNFWTNGSTLRVRFLGGSDHVRQRVVRYANEWARYANLNFAFTNSGPGDIRISFERNGSSWSMLGRQASYADANRPTMNFGWFDDRTSEAEFRRTVLHEFGHALGLLHEHQNPDGGIPWNEDAVYAFYARSQGWDRRTTYQNVIARRDHDETQYSAYDAASIMHYPVDPRLTLGNYAVGLNTALSPTDIRFISMIYPGRNAAPATTSTATTTTTTPPRRTAPTTSKPAPTTPVATTRDVRITNSLHEGQRAEIIELIINQRKYVFNLRQGERTRQTLRLQLRPGTYDYRVRTASVYSVLRRGYEGGRRVQRRENVTVNGGGTGRLRVTDDQQLVFYGEYDKQSRRMKVYLGEAKR